MANTKRDLGLLFLGVFLGALLSWFITQVYYTKSIKEAERKSYLQQLKQQLKLWTEFRTDTQLVARELFSNSIEMCYIEDGLPGKIETGTARAQIDPLIVRTEPIISATKSGVLHNGDTVRIIGRSEDWQWFKVQFRQALTGWVPVEYIRFATEVVRNQFVYNPLSIEALKQFTYNKAYNEFIANPNIRLASESDSTAVHSFKSLAQNHVVQLCDLNIFSADLHQTFLRSNAEYLESWIMRDIDVYADRLSETQRTCITLLWILVNDFFIEPVTGKPVTRIQRFETVEVHSPELFVVPDNDIGCMTEFIEHKLFIRAGEDGTIPHGK